MAKALKRRDPHDDHRNVNIDQNSKQNVNFTGRPRVRINVCGKNVVGFIVTGYAVSFINCSSLKFLNFASRAHKARSLVAVTSALLDTIEEIDVEVEISPSLKVIYRFMVTSACPFPGDVLLGIDFLQ